MTQSTTYNQTTENVHRTAVDSRKPAGVLFVALSAQFLTLIMLAAAMAPNYDFGAAAISDLGVIDETALVFNNSLIAAGVLNLLGGFYFYRTHGKRWLFAVFALDTGGLHSLFALLAFVFFKMQALGTATRLSGVMRGLSVLAGGFGLVFVVLGVGDAGNAAAFGSIGHGGTERMIIYPVMIWLIAFGGYLLVAADRPDLSRIQESKF